MDRLSRRDPKVVSPPDTIFKRKGIKIPFTACEVDGLDRGTIEVRQRSDWLLVGLSSVTTMEKRWIFPDLFSVLPWTKSGRRLLQI